MFFRDVCSYPTISEGSSRGSTKSVKGPIKLYTKGADTVMFERFRANQKSIVDKTAKQVNDFSLEGLRCLLLGYTEIPEDKYYAWSRKYDDARSDLNQIEMKKKGLENNIEALENEIETDLILVGATAIEDKLQDGVPECIEELAIGGINIWVLTGIFIVHTLVYV